MENLYPEVLLMSVYPPQESDLSTYSFNLVKTLGGQFSSSFTVSVCALELYTRQHQYGPEVKYKVDTNVSDNLVWFANMMNSDEKVKLIHIQHSFDSFGGEYGENILYFLYSVFKPVIITFHEVLPEPDNRRKAIVNAICSMSAGINVMTQKSAEILNGKYGIPLEKINVIPYGIHPVVFQKKEEVKEMYGVKNKIVLSTFGLVCPELNIEYALEALPGIIRKYPNVIYRIIGETHPVTKEEEGEIYREYLLQLIRKAGIEKNVEFVNSYLDRQQILEYMEQTDIYLSTSRHTYQTVSSALSYAVSCGCAIISTGIPHALDVVDENTGLIINFRYAHELQDALIKLIEDEKLRNRLSKNAFEKSHSASWNNVAIAHARNYLREISGQLEYNLPEISLEHVQRMTSNFGIIQSTENCLPDFSSGFTLDDNTRALIAVSMHYEITSDRSDLGLLERYISFIENCQRSDGSFMNYVNESNEDLSLTRNDIQEDAFGRAVWALGFFKYNGEILPTFLVKRAEVCLLRALPIVEKLESPCARAFAIKGLWYYSMGEPLQTINRLIIKHAEFLCDLFISRSDEKRTWYSGSLSFSNSVVSEAMLLAFQITKCSEYKRVAFESFELILQDLFIQEHFTADPDALFGSPDQVSHPSDITGLIIALEKFFNYSGDEKYLDKMKLAFTWFLGNNHLGQMVYNPVTGGCFDGLRFNKVILDQSAESTISYLIARVIIERNNSRMMTIKHAAEINSALNNDKQQL